MGFWVALLWNLVINVGAALLGRALSPRERSDRLRPSALGEFSIPTAEEGRVIPAAFRTCHVRGPNCIWYGDLATEAIESDKQVTGYRYYLGMHYVLCHGPVDDVLEVRWDGRVPSTTSVTQPTYKRFTVNAKDLFGQDDGVRGSLDCYFGDLTQVASPYLVSAIGAALPGLRGICHAVLNRPWLGNSPYIKPISFVVRRLPNSLGLSAGAHDISTDANPACMLYEILTNQRWGLGLPAGSIDVAAFRAAGVTLKAEGFGLSMLFDGATSARDMIDEILRHIDALVYSDPSTGLLTLRLIRADYTVGALPVLDASNVVSVELVRPSWEETRNHVRVRYVDRDSDFTERIAQAQDLANIQIRAGDVSAEDVDLTGISNGALAQRAAARELKSRSYPIASLDIVANRTAHAVKPGDVYRLTWAPLGIVDMVVRVSDPGYGTLTDGRVTMQALEDVFSVTWTGYPALPATEWVDPFIAPQALVAGRLMETPYTFGLGVKVPVAGGFYTLDVGEHRRVMTLAVRGAYAALGYEVWSDPAGGTAYLATNSVSQLTPSGVLSAAMTPRSTSLTVQSGVGLSALESINAAALADGRNLLIVDDEIVAWQTVTDNGDGTWIISGLVRGCIDTTPKAHSSAARVWFASNGYGLSRFTPYDADLTLTAKLLPFNTKGTLAIGAATQISTTTVSRPTRPYVPGAVKLNTLDYPVNINDQLVVSWAHRNRLGAWKYDTAGATGSGEPGVTYRVKVYGESGSLIHTETGLTGTSWTYSLAAEISDSGLGRPNGTLRVVVEALNGALVSFQAYDHTTDAAGYGMLYGDCYGGAAA